ncbi:MAG TPA: hypothetical protein V6C97_33540 [Oculatellaceae cyanobacterium]
MNKISRVSLTAVGGAALCYCLHFVTNIPLQIAIGAVGGIFLSSFHESYVHQFLGHAKKKTREFWARHPHIFLPLIEGFFLHHVVHHGKTYREGYLVQFGESLDMAKIDQWGPEAFYRLFEPKDQDWVRRKLPPATIVEHLHAADYGLGAVSGVKFASTVFPLVLLVFAVAPFWMAVAAAVPMLFVYPAMSNTLHRNIMHIPQDGSVGIAVPMDQKKNWFVGSAALKALERWHWMHHEYIYCNYNLLVLADFFRRGARRKPSAKDLEKMEQEGLAMDEWSGVVRFRKFVRSVMARVDALAA